MYFKIKTKQIILLQTSLAPVREEELLSKNE